MRDTGPARPAYVLRGLVGLVLVASTGMMLYTTARTTGMVRALADRSLESTALALAASAERAIREGSGWEAVTGVLSDRVVGYALIAASDGTIVFHTNPDLVGGRLPPGEWQEWFRSERPSWKRTTLGTGLPAFEFNYPIHPAEGRTELLRLVLHTAAVDRLASQGRRLWGGVGSLLGLLWVAGIALDRVIARQLRLREAFERRERLSLLGQMTATLAHEIRNALGSIKGFAQWVDEKTEASDSRKSGLVAVLRGTERIEGLVSDLLLYSREETYRLAPTDVRAAVLEAVAAAVGSWRGKIQLDVHPGVRALADREKLHRVLVNGLRNALDAMGETGTLRISAAAPRRGRVSLRVEDTGPGLAEEALERLFTPFYTTKTDGTGLGLAYSKKVMEGMGGSAELTNRREGGAALTVTLPTA